MMKKTLLRIIAVALLCLPAYLSAATQKTKQTRAPEQQVTRALEAAAIEQAAREGTRALTLAANPLNAEKAWTCGQTTFDSNVPALYAASTAVPTGDAAAYNLTRITVGADGKPAAVALAPQGANDVTINGAVGAKAPSPFKAAVVNHVAIMPNATAGVAGLPLVTVATGADNNKINLITTAGLADGKNVLQSTALKDFTDAASGPVAGIAASSDYMFVAVPATTKNWEDAGATGLNRTIAVLAKDAAVANGLKQRKVANITQDLVNGNQGLKVDPTIATGGNLVAIKDATATNAITTAELGPNVDMTWDSGLSRLYVGLSSVKRDDPTKEGGVCDVLVGRISEKNAFSLAPLIKNFNKEQLYDVAAYRKIKAADAAKQIADTVTQYVATTGPAVATGDNTRNAAKGKALAIVKAAGAPVGAADANIIAAADPTVYTQFVASGISAAEGQVVAKAAADADGNRVSPALNNTVNSAIISGSLVATAAAIAADTVAGAGGGVQIVNAVNSVAKAYADQIPSDLSGLNTDHLLVGFYGDGDATYNGDIDVRLSAQKVRAMHTSTGKDYLIVNAVTGLPATAIAGGLLSKSRDGIYALPLLGAKKADGTTVWDADTDKAAQYAGTLSAVDPATYAATFDAIPQTITKMPRDDKTPFIVGGANPLPGTFVTEMFVLGDTVYFCLNGTKNQQAGIFQSTALFNPHGAIIGWTPTQRVMGNVERVFGGGIDPKTGKFLFMASKANDPSAVTNFYSTSNTPKATAWGSSDAATATNNLTAILDGIFDSSNPLNQIFTFDERTPGFAAGKFSMMVATGGKKIALVQTGKYNAAKGAFDPVKVFTAANIPTAVSADDNVFTFDLSTKNIGNVTSVEVSRSTRANGGWLFVGGENGVAVLSNDNVAVGVDTLAAMAAPVDVAAMADVYYSGAVIVRNAVAALAAPIADKTGVLAALDSFIASIPAKVASGAITTNTRAAGNIAAFALVKQYASAGRGWPSSTGLSALADGATSAVFPGGLAGGAAVGTALNWTFKKLVPTAGADAFAGVRKLVATGDYLFVVTRDKVYRIALDDANKFSATTAAGHVVLGEVVAFDTTLLPASSIDIAMVGISDMVAFGSGTADFVVATIKGLFAATWDARSAKYIVQEVLVGGKSLGPVVHLDFLANAKGGLASEGNLYVLAANFAQDTGKLYRFYVKASAGELTEVAPISSDAYLDMKSFRLNVSTDGSLLFNEVSRDDHVLVNMYNVGVTVTKQTFPTAAPTKATKVGIIKREPASGTWLVPTDAGLGVSE